MFKYVGLGAVLGTLALAGCGAAGGDSGDGGDGDTSTVVTGFYPLAYAVEQVAGDRVEVVDLTRPGAEPHDVELAPRDIAKVTDAGLVVYLSGFQPALDQVVGDRSDRPSLDVSKAADLVDTADVTVEAGEEHTEEGHEEEGHEEEGGDEEGHGHEEGSGTGTDPHFWLDPVRYAGVADEIAKELGDLQPEHAEEFRKNAEEFRTELERLDATYTEQLADCTSRSLVTSHAAFGYLALKYDFEQVGISGLTPESEPAPGRIAELADFVREHDVKTIYYETLVSPAVATTIADETGADTAVLDPIEGVTDASEGTDYAQIMEANLSALGEGQGCRS